MIRSQHGYAAAFLSFLVTCEISVLLKLDAVLQLSKYSKNLFHRLVLKIRVACHESCVTLCHGAGLINSGFWSPPPLPVHCLGSSRFSVGAMMTWPVHSCFRMLWCEPCEGECSVLAESCLKTVAQWLQFAQGDLFIVLDVTVI